MNTHWLVTQGILLEAGSIASLSSDLPTWLKLVLFVSAHAGAVALFSIVLWRLLPTRYRLPFHNSYGFLYVFQFFIPFIGSIGLSSAVLLALNLPRVQRSDPWYDTDEPLLPFKAADYDSYPIYSPGGLIQILRDSPSPEKRLKVVLSLKQMPERISISLLKFALKDPVDDVRLLAYSMLDEKEKHISEEINRHLNSIEELNDSKSDDDERRFLLHQLIANNYWELVYLDLVQGGVRNHVLNQAEQHITQSLDIKQTPSSLKLYGQILLNKKELPKARLTFERAIQHGIEPSSVSPYLAEIAFLNRTYELIPNYLSMYKISGKSQANLMPVLNYWLN